MARKAAQAGKKYRVKPRMKGRLDVQPGRDPVRLPVRRHLAGEPAIGCAVDCESETNTILIENAGHQLKVTDEENDRGQRHVNDACNEQPAQYFCWQAVEF